MPHQQNPERGPAGDSPGGPGRPRDPGHRTATPDAPQLPRPRFETPSRPPANATPPGGRPATPRRTPPSGMPSSGGPPGPDQRPTSVLPGAGPRPSTPVGPPGGSPVPPAGGTWGADGGGPAAGQTVVAEKKSSELGFSKVAAGAGAAVVTAVLGSFLGAVGTVLGAALGSIITTFATTFFQRSIERTQVQVVDRSQKLRERTQRGGAGAQGAAAWQAAARDGGTGVAGPGSQETVRIDPTQVGAAAQPSGSRWRLRAMSRKSIVLAVAGAAVTFLVAMFLVTGIEWIKGSTITGGGSGTSIGNVVSGTSTSQQQSGDDRSGSTGTSTSESTTSTGESDSNRSGTSTSTSQNGGGSAGSSSTSDPLQDGLNRVLPTQGNESGQRQSGQDGSNNSGSGGGANGAN